MSGRLDFGGSPLCCDVPVGNMQRFFPTYQRQLVNNSCCYVTCRFKLRTCPGYVSKPRECGRLQKCPHDIHRVSTARQLNAYWELNKQDAAVLPAAFGTACRAEQLSAIAAGLATVCCKAAKCGAKPTATRVPPLCGGVPRGPAHTQSRVQSPARPVSVPLSLGSA